MRSVVDRRSGGGIEAPTVVFDPQDDSPVPTPQGDFQSGCLSVFEHVGDRLLSNVQKLAFLFDGKPRITVVEVQGGADPCIFRQQSNGFPQGFREAVFLKCQTAEPPDGAPNLDLAETQEFGGFFHLPPGRFRLDGFSLREQIVGGIRKTESGCE